MNDHRLFRVMFIVHSPCIFVLVELRTHTRASPLQAQSSVAYHQLYLLSKTVDQLWPLSAISIINSYLELEAHALPLGSSID